MASILIIDDEDKYLDLCRRHMPEHDFVGPARNYREAAERIALRRRPFDLVLLDVHFDIPEDDLLPTDKSAHLAKASHGTVLERLRRSQGIHILGELRRRHPDLPVMVMTSRDDLPLDADAERLQAEDYTYLLQDEYLDARSLKLQVEGILSRVQRRGSEDDGPFFWGVTREMQRLRSRIGILARGQLPVIIQGATGTGKSLLAREFIHAHSGRGGAFVAVDLSTIPHDLMAAHLFGVVRGAYTGATASRDGVLARANGGTLFLDEIGNLSVDLQKSLLLVLQERRYRPVGAVEERSVDLKLVVATNEDLSRMVREGRFREDLYMRLNPATAIRLPSLRERRDDMEELLAFFLTRVCADGYARELLSQYAERNGLRPFAGDGRPRVGIGRSVPPEHTPERIAFVLAPASWKLLSDFDWPGNFRQLEMLLSNLVTFTLVDLVEHVESAEAVESARGEDYGGARPDVVTVPARVVADLLRPWSDLSEAHDDATRVPIELHADRTLNAVSCNVERQYLEWLYRRFEGDLSKMAGVLLGDEGAGRKIQLRMNQLDMKLRELRRGKSA
jgi:DNA-binding NtrC family response regulator